MLYALLCYDEEKVVNAWSKEKDDAVIARRRKIQAELAAAGKLGPVARLMPTTAATTIRSGAEPLVLDGPFAETKEQLLGFYVIDCENLEEAVGFATRMKEGEDGGSFEIRPLRLFQPGSVTP